MQRILETDFNATVGPLVMHYKECLSEQPKSWQEIGLAVVLHTSVRALSVQSVLRCGTKNAQSVAAAREYFEKRYPSSTGNGGGDFEGPFGFYGLRRRTATAGGP